MIKYFLLFFLPATLFGQNKVDSSFIPRTVTVKPLLDPHNYISPTTQLAVIDYLKSQNLFPQNYFVDSIIIKSEKHWRINIWDSMGLQKINLFEKKRDSLDHVNRTTKGQKFKLPRPVGNPGNCFTVYYDVKKNAIISIELWQ